MLHWCHSPKTRRQTRPRMSRLTIKPAITPQPSQVRMPAMNHFSQVCCCDRFFEYCVCRPLPRIPTSETDCWTRRIQRFGQFRRHATSANAVATRLSADDCFVRANDFHTWGSGREAAGCLHRVIVSHHAVVPGFSSRRDCLTGLPAMRCYYRADSSRSPGISSPQPSSLNLIV